MKLKIKSYILYNMLSIFIQCILHSPFLSLSVIESVEEEEAIVEASNDNNIFLYTFFSLSLETILTAYEKGFTKGLLYPC